VPKFSPIWKNAKNQRGEPSNQDFIWEQSLAELKGCEKIWKTVRSRYCTVLIADGKLVLLADTKTQPT
jgi:hypothetical protein